jgi:hypothetical protein
MTLLPSLPSPAVSTRQIAPFAGNISSTRAFKVPGSPVKLAMLTIISLWGLTFQHNLRPYLPYKTTGRHNCFKGFRH